MVAHYLLLSMKVLLRRKFFTFISIFGISFTLMVLMVVAAMLDHALGPGKPESEQTRMLGVRYMGAAGPDSRYGGSAGYKLFDKYARDLPGAERLTIFSIGDTTTLYLNGERVQRSLKRTDAEFWRILDFDFIEGAPYVTEDVDGARPVAVINRSTRARFFGGQPALGKTIEIDDVPFRIVGVVENVSSFRQEPFADIWTPLTTNRSQAYREQMLNGFQALILARDRSVMPQITDAFNERVFRIPPEEVGGATTIAAPFEKEFDSIARKSPFGDRMSRDNQGWRLVLFLVVVGGLFSALPTVNLININVSRILERSSEIGVRKAFGASASTLVGQFVIENVLLTLVGGAVGLALSAIVLRAINLSGVFPYAQLAVNPRVFAYGLLIALAFGIVSGVYPAWRMARLHPVAALRGGAVR
jgi:putative ABC transport system permease protein